MGKSIRMIDIYTDASVVGKCGGWCYKRIVRYTDGSKDVGIRSGCRWGLSDSYRAEMYAIDESMRLFPFKGTRVCIHTDNRACVSLIEMIVSGEIDKLPRNSSNYKKAYLLCINVLSGRGVNVIEVDWCRRCSNRHMKCVDKLARKEARYMHKNKKEGLGNVT